jgi:predicted RNA-binding protein YlxR (DUF448 family)
VLKKKKIPLRMCLGCQQMKPKKELIRIVRCAADGSIKIDSTGKLSGRGSYICHDVSCFEKAYKTKRIEKALEQKVDSEVYEQLRREIAPND